jgi:predicted nucleotidyltransferase
MIDTKLGGVSASGRFVLRIEPGLHAALRAAAAEAGVSLNEYCARMLTAPRVPLHDGALSVVTRALELFGDSVIGLVLYGSWARDEVGAASDVDVLVVFESELPITRNVYRLWDSEPVFWESHRVEPHFVHLPEPRGRITGTWAEAAVDGIVLFERDFLVSRRLVALRRRIAEGVYTRRWAHGQPYWVVAA